MEFHADDLPDYLKDAHVLGVSDLSTWMCCPEDREAAKGQQLIIYRLSDKGLELKDKLKAESNE